MLKKPSWLGSVYIHSLHFMLSIYYKANEWVK